MEPVRLNELWDYTDVDRAFWAEHLEGWLPERIIDAHVHVTNTEFRMPPTPAEEAEARKPKPAPYWPGQVSRRQDAADLERCVRTVYPGRQVQCVMLSTTSRQWDHERMNEWLRTEAVKRDWFSTVPLDPEATQEELAAWLDRPGVIGVKPYYSMIRREKRPARDAALSVGIFDFCPDHLLEVLNDRRAWMTLHVPRPERLADPDNIREIKEMRRRYPDMVLVLAHIGRCYAAPYAEEAIPQLADDPGLYFDTSAVLNPATLRLTMQLCGWERLCYGTDNPVFYMRGRRTWRGREYINLTSGDFQFNKDTHEPPEVEAKYTLYMYEAMKATKDVCEELGVGPEGVEGIFYANARRLIDRVQEAKAARLRTSS